MLFSVRQTSTESSILRSSHYLTENLDKEAAIMCPSIPPHSSQTDMGLTEEDMECCVCLQSYSRRDKIPRMLHCKHTFCGQCLQALSRPQSGLLTVCCPLCRWITCTRASLPIAGSLWINTDIWDRISERQEEEQEENEAWMRANRQTQTSTQDECSSSGNCGLRFTLKNFLRRKNKGGKLRR